MEITIELRCPNCDGKEIVRNGKKWLSKKQNYLCKECGRQFIGDHALDYKGCHSQLAEKIRHMLVRGLGIRDIAIIEKVSVKKVLSVLINSKQIIKPKQTHYDKLEVDEFWTYVGDKRNKVWLIYAYHRQTGEIVAWVWGKRDLKTAQALKDKIDHLGISFDTVYTDNWSSFVKVFALEHHIISKAHTVGIEGNNCRLRTRIRRAFRKTCCFSKCLFNHFKAFELAFFYLNFGYV